MTLNAKIGIFMDFFRAISGCDTKSFTKLRHGTILYALRRYACNNGVLFYHKFLHRFSLNDIVVL